MERASAPESSLSARDLAELARQVYLVDLSGVSERYAEVVFRVRDLGIALSDVYGLSAFLRLAR